MDLGAHYFWGYKTVTAILIKNETLSYVYTATYGNICDAEPSRLSNYDVSHKLMNLGAKSAWKHLIILNSKTSIGDYCPSSGTGTLRVESHSLYGSGHDVSPIKLECFLIKNLKK